MVGTVWRIEMFGFIGVKAGAIRQAAVISPAERKARVKRDLRPGVVVTLDDPFVGCQFTQCHRAARV